MVDFKARRHRLELPAMPNSDDPAVLKRAMDQMKRLVQDEFNRLSTDFYDFKKATYNAAIIPLRGVANIVVTSDEYSMNATWENPDGDEITPTHVRVRILEISPNSWATYTYPITSWEFNGLDPGTQYTFQVQLIATFESTDSFVSTSRNCPSVPVLRTAESDIKARVFTTATGVGPPTDAGTNDDNVIFIFPNTDGTPGPAGGTDCYWGYKFQYRTACAWADTAVSEVEVDGDVGNVTIDTGNAPFSTYPDTVFRLAYREICNGVPQAWVYGNAFMAVDFSNADCLGIAKSVSLTTVPYSAADLFALPGVCQADGTPLQIVDALTDTEFLTQSPGFGCVEYIDGEWTLIGADTTDPAVSPTVYQPMLVGQIPAIADLNETSDFTLTFEIKVPDSAALLAGLTGPIDIITIGEKIQVQMIQNITSIGYRLQVVVPRDGGGAYVFTTEPIAYGTWATFYYVHDVSEADGRVLYLNGVEVARSANAILNDFTGITSDVRIFTVNEMQIRTIYAFNAVVSGEEAITPTMIYSNYVQTGAVDAHSIAHDASIRSGDLIVVCIRTDTGNNGDAALSTPPTGFTLVERDDSSAMYYKIADGTETGNVTVNATASSSISISGISIQYIRGCDPDRPFGGFFASTGYDVFQGPVNLAEAVQTVHQPFNRYLPEGVGIFGVVMHSAVEDASAPATPASTEIVAADMTVTNVQRSSTTGTFAVVTDAEDIVDETVTLLTLEWATSSAYSQFWFMVQAPQTTIWAARPRIIENTIRDTQGSNDKDVLLSPDIEDGDLVVFVCFQMPWDDVTGYDGMTEELELRTGSSRDYVLVKVYATADGDRYTLTTAAGYSSLSIRHMVFRIKNASGAVQAAGAFRTNANSGTTVPYIDVPITPAVGDLLIATAFGISSDALVYNTANGWTDAVKSRLFTGGPTPDGAWVWAERIAESATSQNMPIFADDTGATMFDRTGIIIAITPA